MDGEIKDLIPIFGMAFVGLLFYFEFRGKQLKIKEKLALIEKGLDPSLMDSKAKNKQNTNNQYSYKIGLLLIGVALGVMMGYLLNLSLGVPNFVAYSSMILVFCGITLVYFHKSKTE